MVRETKIRVGDMRRGGFYRSWLYVATALRITRKAEPATPTRDPVLSVQNCL